MKPCSIVSSSCSTFAIGATQFVVQEAFETMLCAEASYSSSLTPSTTVTSGSVAGAEISTFFAPAVEMLLGLVALREQPGGLDRDVDAEIAPGQLGGRPDVEPLDRLPGDGDRVVADLDVPAERPEDGVVLEQVRHRVHVADVVGGHDLEVAASVEMGAQEVASDASEAVDANS